jgi:Protein phosphatase 2C
VFSVEQVVSIVGEGPMNEDAVGWTVGAAWVIDGATPLGKPHTVDGLTSAAWYAARLSNVFSRLSVDAVGLKAAELVNRAQIGLAGEMVNRGIGETPYPPSASAAYLAATGESIEIVAIGDVEALVVDKSGNIEVISNYLTNITVHTADGEIKWGDISDLHEQRQAILNDRGYSHVLSLAPLHSTAILERTFTASQLRRILICSDGFARLRNLTRKSALSAIARGEVTLCEAARILRQLESQIRVMPPGKISDDATALLLSFPGLGRPE